MSTKLDPVTYFGNFTNVYFILMNKWQELTSFGYSLLLGESQLKLQVSILLWKEPPKLCIECHLVPLWAFPPKSPGPSAPYQIQKQMTIQSSRDLSRKESEYKIPVAETICKSNMAFMISTHLKNDQDQ